jgi:ABC-type transport system involved in multi-copper enzyme maturation permease subunit
MMLLPIVARELREAARRRSTRVIRLVVAAVALVLSLFQLAFTTLFSHPGSSSGSASFALMTGYAFVLCLLAGVFITADCLSEEKREGTLGLLFLTDLRGYDVVLGKLASQAVHLGYALLAVIPAAALPMLIGGVTAGELWRISLALGNLLFFSLAAGMLASAACRLGGRAMLLTGSIVAIGCIGLPWFEALVWFSPATAYGAARESNFVLHSSQFWAALGLSHLLGWGMIAAASWRLPRSWQDKPVANAQPPPPLPGAAPGAAPAAVLPPALLRPSRRPRALLDQEPLLWLIGERPGLKAGLWALCGLWSVMMLVVGAFNLMEGVQMMLVFGWAGLLLVKVLFAAQACQFFAETRRAGAFELLLSAPVNAGQLVSAQWRALCRWFGPPLLLAGASGLAAALLLLLHGMTSSGAWAGGLAFGGVGVGFVLVVEVLDFIALGWLGMWLALTMRKPHLATGASILYVLILPSLAFCWAFFIGPVVDIVLIAVFASKLRGDLRALILDRPGYAPTPRG